MKNILSEFKFKKVTVILIFTVIPLFFFSSQVYTPPKELYQVETENYRFVFEKDLYYFYEEISEYAEDLYVKYKYFYNSNPGKISVFILDDVDFTNSFALTSTNVIRLYINPPEDFLALGNNVEDWSRFVLSHELTHIFYGSDVRDPLISWIPNKLIKNTINMVHQPSYLHEGLSIYMESKNFGGRFEDDLFNMYLRAEILSNQFPRYYLGTGSSIDVWSPAGFNYMYGAILVREIVENYGENSLREIVKILNRNIFSNIDEAFEWVTGVRWERFVGNIKKENISKYDSLIEKGYKFLWVEIDETYQNTGNLRTDGESVYGYLEMPNKPKGIYKNNDLIKKNVNSFDVNENGDLLYLVTTYSNGFYTNKLYYDCGCPAGEKLIDERVKAFAFVGTDKVIYSKLDKGLTAIYLYDLKTNKSRMLIDYGKYVVNSIDSENNLIYFSINYKNQTDIYAFDLETENFYRITNDSFKELQIFVKDNNIYYSANYKDNIYNIYKLDLNNNKLEQLTNYITGGFNPVILNNKLYHLFYDHEGYHLTYLDLIEENNYYDTFLKDETVLIEFEKYALTFPEDYGLDKYNFEKPYFIPYPVLLVDENENIFYGAGTVFVSEATNYLGVIQSYTDGNEFYLDLGITFDYYTTNSINVSLGSEEVYSDFYISNNYLLYLGQYVNTSIGGGIGLTNASLEYYRIDSIFQIEPYSVNNYDIYNFGLGLSYASDSGILAVLDKPFVAFDTKITPYVGYGEGSIYLGSSIDKVLWRPYLSFESGKYRFDGIVIGADVSYDFVKEEIDYMFYIQFDLSAFYWLNLPLRLSSDMFF